MKDPRITEQRNPASSNIDLATSAEIVRIMNSEDRLVAEAVGLVSDHIALAISACEHSFRSGGRLIYVGAGTSGRLGVLDASECPPTFGTPPEMVVGIIAGGRDALVRAQEGAEDSIEAGRRDILEIAVSENDFVVGIASSGTTPYVWAALEAAQNKGASTCMVACTPIPDSLKKFADISIVPIVGPEVVTGSTRLKSGTATKMVLNMISTGAMIRIGKTYGNIMVDLRATNAKLKDRSVRIVMEICGLEREEAAEVLAQSGGEVKVAILMALQNLDLNSAKLALARNNGSIRRAVDGVQG